MNKTQKPTSTELVILTTIENIINDSIQQETFNFEQEQEKLESLNLD